jgi:manganese transport protein
MMRTSRHTHAAHKTSLVSLAPALWPQVTDRKRAARMQDAHDLLEQILNSRLAPLAFGLALLLTGQMSTFTGTIAGQVVMSGFLGRQSSTLARRLGTRALAILPALVVQLTHGAAGTYKCVSSGPAYE